VPARRWSDEQLRDAIATYDRWVDVCAALGISPKSGSRSVRRRCDELGVEYDHIGRRRRWSDEELARAVAASTNLRQVFEALGLAVGGGTWQSIQDHIRRLGLSTAHWDRPVPTTRVSRRPRYSWSDQELLQACDGARSVREVMGRLGLDPDRKRGRRALERRMREVGVEPRELPGQGWSRGRRVVPRYRVPLQELLVDGKAISSTSSLKKRLVEGGLLAWRCDVCGISGWRGRPLSLQLDHVNGDRWDNRLENLRLLCPNCHSQTDTFAGRNVGNGYAPDRD
jgi:hypothetical protein